MKANREEMRAIVDCICELRQADPIGFSWNDAIIRNLTGWRVELRDKRGRRTWVNVDPLNVFQLKEAWRLAIARPPT